MNETILSEICLVANLQTVGPTYLTEVQGDILDYNSGMLLSARIVITSGMGSQTGGLSRLNGPIPISELDLDKKYECYYFPIEMKQLPNNESYFSTGFGSYIICVIFEEQYKNKLKSLEHLMENILMKYGEQIDFSNTSTGEISEEKKNEFKLVLTEIWTELNETLYLADKYQGGSLYDIGLIATLPEQVIKTAKFIMLHPEGILEEEIKDKIALRKLYQSGLVEKVNRNNQVWIVPK